MGRIGLLRKLFGEQITKHKRIALNYFAGCKFDRLSKKRTVENKSVEFAVLSAGIHAWREIGEERLIQLAAGKAGIEHPWVNANCDGAKSERVELANQLTGVSFPKWKDCLHFEAREILFAIGAQVFQENIAEGDAANSLVQVVAHRRFHAGFVNGIDALRRDKNLVQRQTE